MQTEIPAHRNRWVLFPGNCLKFSPRMNRVIKNNNAVSERARGTHRRREEFIAEGRHEKTDPQGVSAEIVLCSGAGNRKPDGSLRPDALP